MQSLSKRSFLKACYHSVVAALLYPLIPLGIGCTQRNGYQVSTEGIDDKPTKPSRTPGAAQVTPDFEPGYLALHRTGEPKERGENLWSVMDGCALCPRRCGADRLAGDRGFCGASSKLEISSHHPHYGEERPLVGRGGSGTIFLTNCGPRCRSWVGLSRS